jgi:streptogramin lyase
MRFPSGAAALLALFPLLSAHAQVQRPIGGLKPTAVLALGKTADWVAISDDAVWVGSTGPNALHRIDPSTNREVASVALPGEPCAGLATGFGAVWVPLCGAPGASGAPARLARVSMADHSVTLFASGPLAEEGGVATSADSVWLVSGAAGELHRIDPASGKVRQMVKAPAGSYNPLYSAGRIWLSRADGAEVTVIDAVSGQVLGSVATGPGPRFQAAGAGAVWSLNQGDGSLSRMDAERLAVSATVALRTPGRGGDIAFGSGMVWTTMSKTPLSMTDAASNTLRCQWTGPGGDSLGVGHGAIWLTDYHGGTVSRIELAAAIAACPR